MPNVKDVAQYCGVSYTTVSNVVNNKGNVSENTRRRVEEAIRKLKYIPHEGARTLKGTASKIVGVVIPSIDDPYMARFYIGVQESLLIKNGYMINLVITDHTATVEEEALEELLKHRIAGLILVSCRPDNPDAFKLLRDSRLPVVLVDRYVDVANANFASFDYRRIGKHLCTSLLDRSYRRIALITGPSTYSSKKDLIEGFRASFSERHKDPEDLILVTSVYNRFGAFQSMVKLLNREYGESLPDIVVTSSKALFDGAKEALLVEGESQGKPIDIVSFEEDYWMRSANVERVMSLYRPAKTLGIAASELLLENKKALKVHTPRTKILNCYDLASEISRGSETDRVPVKPNGRKGTLTLSMLKDNSTWAIKSLLPVFFREFGDTLEVDIRQYRYDDLYTSITGGTEGPQSPSTDIVMIDNPWLPFPAKSDYLLELSEYVRGDNELQGGFIPKVFESCSTFKSNYYALPFNFEVQPLFYRKDLFSDEKNRRDFSKQYGIEFNLPRTWDEYNAIAEFFSREYSRQSPIEYGATATGATTTICDYLPRLWACGGNLFDPSGRAIFDSLEAIEALNSYVSSFRYAPRNAAMMIMFIAHTSRLFDLDYSSVAGKFDVGEVPGGHPVMSGWSLGITKACPNPNAAYRFMRWTCSSKIAIPYTVLGGCTPRSSLNQIEELSSSFSTIACGER